MSSTALKDMILNNFANCFNFIWYITDILKVWYTEQLIDNRCKYSLDCHGLHYVTQSYSFDIMYK